MGEGSNVDLNLTQQLKDKTKTVFIITSSLARAEALLAEIKPLTDKEALLFPAPDETAELIGQRLNCVWRLTNRRRFESSPVVIIASNRAVAAKTSKTIQVIKLPSNQVTKLSSLVDKLVALGYKRFDIVGSRGEFSVRGGILDVFPLNFDNPVRIEFVDDKIEEMRFFDSYSQRSIKKRGFESSLFILPAVEQAEVEILSLLPKDAFVVRDLEPAKTASRPKPAALIKEGVADELLADLKKGDFVVHEHYGVAKFNGMAAMEIDGLNQEYLLLEFAENARVYVPPNMAGLVEKYSSGSSYKPKLSKLGTRKWELTRGRVKKSLEDMTVELLELYAAREKSSGFAYSPDDHWQRELEETFPYDETPDQHKAIVETKQDMESSRPMDRLICGDVGYGKTEVAIRAAAKAASAGKQVAVLVPTTILADQHYNNFKERFKSAPFNIEMLSRFRRLGEQKKILERLAAGKVDIIIGTHRLLSKDVLFHDLGLLIIDEEQRFGVKHKEKLKKLKKNVDVLTLSATPIPRTLYLSLSGARDMSVINTAPIDRSPIKTYVLPYSEAVIKEAILKELDREGQVYFLHNKVETLEAAAAKLKRLVPGARVGVGHGQMNGQELEKVMLKFLERKYDVLVCTSIIESGLDIPSVNTILIDEADHFGLSQLYQIRGRVGRSPVRAYAYLFYYPEKLMTEDAVARLKAIQEFTALGSGYKLAMRDLEIRGAGNLLGREQSGHVLEVGFDLYCELLEKAVKHVKGEKETVPNDVEIDLKIEAFIPPGYVEDERQRIALYRRLNLLRTRFEIDEIKLELKDRFGKLPAPLLKLFDLLYLKATALSKEIKKIKEVDGKIIIEKFSGQKKTLDARQADRLKLVRQYIGE